MTRGRAHLARAGILGIAALALALGGHVAASGSVPGPLALVALTGLTSAAVLVLTLRRLHTASLLTALGLLQAGLHGALSLTTTSGTAAVIGSTPGALGHHHHITFAVTGSAAPQDLAMTAAHVVATVLTALLLARAEDLVWLAAAIVTPRVRLARPPAPARRLQVAPRVIRLVQRHHAVRAPLRGPPVLV